MLLDRDWIAARIPHQGVMCLLDRVERWDQDGLRCIAITHRSEHNPLRAHGKLASVCGIEYAAQAMAVHGALSAGQEGRPRAGYLASVRGTVLHVDRLDNVDGDLAVEVRRLGGDGNTVLYDFTLHAGGRALVEGRAAVVIDADAISKF